MVGRERVVVAELVDPNGLRAHVHGAQRRAEAEALDVPLGRRDPVVRHHLLELVLVTVVEEGVRRRVGGLPGLAHDRRPPPAQEAAPVEVGQRDVVVGRLERRVVGVLPIREALVAEVGDRVRQEHPPRTRARAGARHRRLRPSHQHQHRGHSDDQTRPHGSPPSRRRSEVENRRSAISARAPRAGTTGVAAAARGSAGGAWCAGSS